MLISVIVPVYNVRFYLEKCLDSICLQTYKNIEVLCIDDGSTDGSSEICDFYAKKDDRVKVIHKVNGGVSSARNLGISHAKGMYIMFVDSDDWLDLDYLQKAVDILMTERPVLLMNNYVKDYPNGNIVNKFQGVSAQCILNKEEALQAICSNRFTGWEPFASFYEAKACKKIKFDESICFGEDLLFKFTFIQNAGDIFVYAPLASYHYFMRSGSACTSYTIDRKVDDLKVFEHVMDQGSNAVQKIIFSKEYFPRLVRYVSIGYSSTNKEENDIAVNVQKKLRKHLFRALLDNDITMKVKIKAIAASFPKFMVLLFRKLYKNPFLEYYLRGK